MPQNREAEAFLNRIISLPKGPGISLDAALQPSLDDELELRKLFAGDKANPRLNDPYVGLVDVFDAPDDIRLTRARVVSSEEDLPRNYIMPLAGSRRRTEGSLCIVNSIEEFQRNWTIFSEGALLQLKDWDNVVAAGGAVSACLAPLSEVETESKRAIRKHYHSVAYPSSDVDLFLWGLDAEQAERKINVIYEAVRDSVPWDVTCIRTKHTVSIHSQYPYRSIQIVLRLYTSPAEILAGFDIDAPCSLYNGKRVFCNPRAIVSMMRQYNTVDMSRRSPSYEVRLAKYAERGFEVYVPTLRRESIDPTIYERSITRITGLARLLVLEKLKTATIRDQFLASRRTLRGRPANNHPFQRYNRRKKRYKGDLKADNTILGLESNDYDAASVGGLHIPYGPGWDARRIDRLVYQTDLGMNSPYNPKNKARRLHRHPAFFGTMKECLEDCCEHCPEPIDSDENALQVEEDESYVRGRIAFIQDNPGRQLLSGSFNPITVGEWSAQAYIGATEKLFTAIVSHDRTSVSQMLNNSNSTGMDLLHRRDHVGRTPLHVAILSGAKDIACDLIDAGARITARLVDGRCALHLGAQFGYVGVVRKLLERSASNKATANGGEKVVKAESMEEEKGAVEQRASSEDDWSSTDEGVIALNMDADDEEGEVEENESDEAVDEQKHEVKVEKTSDEATQATKEGPGESQTLPEDLVNDPDILDVNLPDWDLAFTPLAYAVISGTLACVEVLLDAGADATFLPSTAGRTPAFHPLALTILREEEQKSGNVGEDKDETSSILQRLISSGASASTADDDNMRTIFHRAVVANKTKMVLDMLKYDPNADKVLNFPAVSWNEVVFPIVSAISRGNYSMCAVLLAYGAKISFTEDELNDALEAISQKKRPRYMAHSIKDIYLPVETALTRHDDVVQLLISLGADFNIGLRDTKNEHTDPSRRKTIVDWVRFGIESLSKKIASTSTPNNAASLDELEAQDPVGEWKSYLADYLHEDKVTADAMKTQQQDDAHADEVFRKYQDAHRYLVDVEAILCDHDAKTWDEIHPDKPFKSPDAPVAYTAAKVPSERYALLSASYHRSTYVPQHLGPAYDELYEACFTGDTKKVEQLCLPQEGSEDTTPLHINVQIADPENVWTRTGYTPLFAAVRGRQWTMARLIMAISTAQYTPPNEEEKFSTKGLNPYDDDPDSDDNSSDSGDSNVTVEQDSITFFDIAKRASTVESDVHPRIMLDTINTTWRTKDLGEKYAQHQGNHLIKAVHDNDLETFAHIFGLYLDSPLPTAISPRILTTILEKDRPDLLDEYIRRTGQGIDVEQEALGEEVARNDKNRVYLGLNVHGKKRADLATMGNRNAPVSTPGYPLVWEAAAKGAQKAVEYLAGERPLAAYQYYASTGKDQRAYHLRRIPDLRQSLPAWLGWTVSNMGDSPLMAAILGKDLNTIKAMFGLKPKFMALCLHERIKFAGFNALFLAANVGCSTIIVDFLLEKSVSPVVNDSIREWNIYHVLCNQRNDSLLEHMLQKLPRDVSEALLAQQSKGYLNTPLHLAVKAGATRASNLIVKFTTSTSLMRNLDGSAPLHVAVQLGYGEIAEALIRAGRSDALYMENGIGETPLDMATLKYRLDVTRNFAKETSISPKALNLNQVDEKPQGIDLVRLETELPKLRQAIDDLQTEGRLVEGTKLSKAFSEFVTLIEGKLAAEKVAFEGRLAATTAPEDKSLADKEDRERTLEAISQGQSKAPGRRLLVHLVDVQKSVQGDLKKHTRGLGEYKSEAGSDEEKVEEMNKGLVWSRIRIYPEL